MSKDGDVVRSLFVKIFLWFWLAMTIVSAASVILAVSTRSHPLFATGWFGFLVMRMRDFRGMEPHRPPPSPELRITEGALKLSGQTAAEIFERDGVLALSNYLDRLEIVAHLRLLLIDRDNKEVSGRDVSREVLELATRAAERDEPAFNRTEGRTLMAYEIRSPGDNPYVVVAQLPQRPPGPGRFEQWDLAAHLATILIVAGIVCYGLARYISSPIRRLQVATRRIAGGDLMARVGGAVKNRGDEIADLSKDFDIMAARIESLMVGQRRLLRDISHELRSPLARLVIALELGRRRANPEVLPALDRIERESGRLNELIGQLLAVARLESGVDKTENKPVNIIEVVRDVAADARFEAENRKCTVRVSLDREERSVSGTEYLLRSAIENIVRNAVHYTNEGTEVEIAVRGMQAADGPQTAISVRDRGAGVPDDVLADLFRPFYRVGEARERKKGGVGLGLTIAEGAVRLHGGTITAANAPEGGLLVTIILPDGTDVPGDSGEGPRNRPDGMHA